MTDDTAGALRSSGTPASKLGGAENVGFRLARYFTGRDALVLALIAILGFLAVYPLTMLFYGSLHSTPPGMAGEFNLNGYRSIMTASNVIVLLNTIGISLGKTIPALLMAVFLAWI